MAGLWSKSHSVVSDCDPTDCSPPGTSPGHLPNPGIKPGSPALQEDSLSSELPGKPLYIYVRRI